MDITVIVRQVGDFAWGPIMIVFLVGTGLYLTLRMGLIQIRGFTHAWALISGKYDRKEDEGEVTHFQALCTALNIAGVATAIASGGPGAVLSASAYNSGLPVIGNYTVTFGLVFFAFSTMLSWSYYGDRCAQYLFGNRAVMIYRWVFVVLIVVGAIVQLEFVWSLSDAMNGLMAIPNLIGLLGLSGLVARETRKYVSQQR